MLFFFLPDARARKVRLVPLAHKVPQAPLESRDLWVRPALKVPQGRKAMLVRRVLLARLGRRATLVPLDRRATLARLDLRALPDRRAIPAQWVPQGRLVHLVQQVPPAQPVRLVRKDRLARLAHREKQDPLHRSVRQVRRCTL